MYCLNDYWSLSFSDLISLFIGLMPFLILWITYNRDKQKHKKEKLEILINKNNLLFDILSNFHDYWFHEQIIYGDKKELIDRIQGVFQDGISEEFRKELYSIEKQYLSLESEINTYIFMYLKNIYSNYEQYRKFVSDYIRLIKKEYKISELSSQIQKEYYINPNIQGMKEIWSNFLNEHDIFFKKLKNELK